jgi:hypothetical protein
MTRHVLHHPHMFLQLLIVFTLYLLSLNCFRCGISSSLFQIWLSYLHFYLLLKFFIYGLTMVRWGLAMCCWWVTVCCYATNTVVFDRVFLLIIICINQDFVNENERDRERFYSFV